VSDVLHWRDLHCSDGVIGGCTVGRGQAVRLVVEGISQYQFMDHLFRPPETEDDDSWPMWLESGAGRFRAGTEAFVSRIGTMIRHRGLMANLSMRENLLLPFLYRGDREVIEQAYDEVEDVADLLA